MGPPVVFLSPRDSHFMFLCMLEDLRLSQHHSPFQALHVFWRSWEHRCSPYLLSSETPLCFLHAPQKEVQLCLCFLHSWGLFGIALGEGIVTGPCLWSQDSRARYLCFGELPEMRMLATTFPLSPFLRSQSKDTHALPLFTHLRISWSLG